MSFVAAAAWLLVALPGGLFQFGFESGLWGPDHLFNRFGSLMTITIIICFGYWPVDRTVAAICKAVTIYRDKLIRQAVLS